MVGVSLIAYHSLSNIPCISLKKKKHCTLKHLYYEEETERPEICLVFILVSSCQLTLGSF